ncbi:hypothetical protein GE21DRAFT_1310143 [Neurospora crassa]|nr:hypothetical protein GE21DRAFT_1310143 [Neurospora crassa]
MSSGNACATCSAPRLHYRDHHDNADVRLQLLNIRAGPGAALLPKEVTKVHMQFAHRIEEGHMGPRKFWRENLPKLKYWNPAVPMVINRTTDQKGPAVMTIYFRDDKDAKPSSTPFPTSSADGSSPAPKPAQGERIVTIDMKNRNSSVILKEFLDKTGAVAVQPTAKDEEEFREFEDLHRRSEIDRERIRKMNDAKKREKAMLAKAMSDAQSIKAASA